MYLYDFSIQHSYNQGLEMHLTASGSIEKYLITRFRLTRLYCQDLVANNLNDAPVLPCEVLWWYLHWILAIYSYIHCHDKLGYCAWKNPCNWQLSTKQHNPDFPPIFSNLIYFHTHFLRFVVAVIDTCLVFPITSNDSLVLLFNRHQFNDLIIQCIHHTLFFKGLFLPFSISLIVFLLSYHVKPAVFVGLQNPVLDLKGDIIKIQYVGQNEVLIFQCLCQLLLDHHYI